MDLDKKALDRWIEREDPRLTEEEKHKEIKKKNKKYSKKNKVCISCTETIKNKEFTTTEDGILCNDCLDHDLDEPSATIKFSDQEDPIYVGSYSNSSYEELPFKFDWINTDGWRGYYKVIAESGWTELHSDCILAMSEDATDLKEFDTAITEFLEEKGIIWARIYTRTSNVFSQGYDLFIKTEDKNIIEIISKVAELKEMFRDSDKFLRTALSGSSEKTNTSDLLIKCVKKLEKGEKLEDIKKEIEKHINEA